MKIPSLSVASALFIFAPSVSAQDAAANNIGIQRPPPVDPNLPACNYMHDDNIPKYHLDSTCDRRAHNDPKRRMAREKRYRAMIKKGVNHIPDEKTQHCPQEVHDWSISEYGHPTKWLVENISSGPVVVIWFDNGREISALNNISPPQADPDAILQPSQWASIDVYEGHVFYVRQLIDELTLGNILLQYRPGMIPVTNSFGHKLPCEPINIPPPRQLQKLPPKKQEAIITQALNTVDPEPIIKINLPEKVHEIRDPGYARAPEHWDERCNILYKGFRNTLKGCGLHVFYVGMQRVVDGPMTCREEFKFHLGIHENPNDYMFDWHSRTKFEATFVDHTFVARLASDPNIVVDEITLKPTLVSDCPNLKQTHRIRTVELNTADPTGNVTLSRTALVDSNVKRTI